MTGISRVTPNVMKGLLLAATEGSVPLKVGNSLTFSKNLDGFSYTGELTTTGTSALQIPAGPTSGRPPGENGKIRFNEDLDRYEGYKESLRQWGPLGVAGVSGIYLEHDITLAENVTVSPGKNAISAGPVTIPNGFSVTVPVGSVWTVV